MNAPFLHQDLELKNELVEYARKLMQKEGEDEDVAAAKALYEKLGPTEIEHGPTYSYEVK